MTAKDRLIKKAVNLLEEVRPDRNKLTWTAEEITEKTKGWNFSCDKKFLDADEVKKIIDDIGCSECWSIITQRLGL